MRKLLYIISAASLVLAFSLSTISAQENKKTSIEFNKTVHDFGDININSGAHSYSFIFRNISDQPVVIQTVISSCGCTTPEWTRNPVKPGEKGKINVTFLNDQGPYPFDKSLTVYVTGSSRPIILRIKGVVNQRSKTARQQFPIKLGSIGIKRNPVEYGQISANSISKGAIEAANLANNPIKITFTNFTRGFYINAVPNMIPAGGKTDLIFSIDTKAYKGWGTETFSATPVINGKKSDKPLLVKATILEDFGNMSKEDLSNAPLPLFTNSSYNFGKIKAGTIIKTSFDFKNVGKRDLIIHSIGSDDNSVKVNYKERTSSGSSENIAVTIDTKGIFGEKIFILTLITNSPTRPIVNLTISGEVTK